jgi:acetolactate synthase-1/2/3 large subunit
MLETPKTVIFDCVVDKNENCLPMIPSGKAHNEMILPGHDAELETAIDAAGKMLV